jgi:ATP-dependent HslUV protease subunit HslV
MTTIACDGKSMAADGASSAYEVIHCTKRKKLSRLSDGSIIGTSGGHVDREAFREWLENGGKAPKVVDFSALRLMPDGRILYYGDTLEGCEVDTPAAVGSGSQFAIGAMEAGLSAKRAVEIASKRDPWTGGQITMMRRA